MDRDPSLLQYANELESSREISKIRIAVLQPYVFPYLPYFQLVEAVDCFVVLDTVQFIRRGWMHRNRIRLGDQAHMFTLPVKKAPRSTPISDIVFAENIKEERKRLIVLFDHAYRGAKNWSETRGLLSQIVSRASPGTRFSMFAQHSIRDVASYLGSATEFFSAGDLLARTDQTYQEYIIDICKILKAETYVNPIGGLELYSDQAFQEQGIELRFLQGRASTYQQASSGFIPDLSILDYLANIELRETRSRLLQYDLVSA